MQTNYTYASALAASQRINWRVEDIIDGEKRLDFAKPFMPEALARVGRLDFLDARELVLNQIRGHGYLYMFGLVEEFILPFLLDHCAAGSPATTRAPALCCSSPARRPSTSTSSSASARFPDGVRHRVRRHRTARGGRQGGAGAHRCRWRCSFCISNG